MRGNPDPAEIWVIHEDQAMLFRQHEGQDIEELRMPFNTFVGSATALASFSLPDTCVYLNLGPAHSEYKMNHGAGLTRFWAGMAESPARLIVLPAEDWQIEMLDALKSMNKKARVISVSNVMHFRQATEMLLLDQQELKHLQAAMRLAKSGSGQNRIALQLAAGLWIKPHRDYQKLRLVAACGIMLGALAMTWTLQPKASLPQKNLAPLSRTERETDQKNTPAPFTAWAEQLRKFGQDNRANLLSVSLFWTDQGHIHTQVQLDRERKRVPKGCKLTAPDQATCTTGRNDQ